MIPVTALAVVTVHLLFIGHILPGDRRWCAPHICGSQDEHHPAAITSFPGNSWQAPCLEPYAPW